MQEIDSFPLELASFPQLAINAAFAGNQVYTKADVAAVVAHGRACGVRVVYNYVTMILDHFSRISSSTPPYARRVRCGYSLSARGFGMLIGACNPMMWPRIRFEASGPRLRCPATCRPTRTLDLGLIFPFHTPSSALHMPGPHPPHAMLSPSKNNWGKIGKMLKNWLQSVGVPGSPKK